MKGIFRYRIAVFGLLSLLSVSVIFHLLVVAGIIPFDIVWGGRVTDRSEMLMMETISVLINLFMISVVAIKAGFLKWRISGTVITVGLWLMFTLFILNTIGNLLSNNEFEKMVFTPLTLLLAILSFRLARSKK